MRMVIINGLFGINVKTVIMKSFTDKAISLAKRIEYKTQQKIKLSTIKSYEEFKGEMARINEDSMDINDVYNILS